MRFLRWLFRREPVIETNDPVLGYLTYEGGIWAFIPTDSTPGVMITVDAPEAGPSDRQRDFFERIKASLTEFEQRARLVIQSSSEENIDASCLSVYSIEIGSDTQCQLETFVLEMSDENAFVIHRVRFSGSDACYDGFDD